MAAGVTRATALSPPGAPGVVLHLLVCRGSRGVPSPVLTLHVS